MKKVTRFGKKGSRFRQPMPKRKKQFCPKCGEETPHTLTKKRTFIRPRKKMPGLGVLYKCDKCGYEHS